MTPKSSKKTVMRTVRLTKELDELLKRDSGLKNISVGTLISTILSKYSEWDRFTEKFDMITLRHESIKAILEAADEQALIAAATELGAKIPKEFLMFWFKEESLESYIRYLELICNYGGFARFELESDGRHYVITLLHNMGEKWSIFLRHVMDQGIRTTIGLVPQFELNKGSLVIKLHAP